MSGYNLILNPVGIESVWRNTLMRMGYTKKETDNFLCGPAFYAWQWMMNMTGWAGGAPDSWYEQRIELAGKINNRLHAFGASAVTSAFIGMVPDDFTEHYPDAVIADQGYWCKMKRPSLMMPDSPHYEELADIYFEESKKISGSEYMHYYSADPFHEGGITKGIDLASYGTKILDKMLSQDENTVWMFQGWTISPKPEMMAAIPEGRAIVTNLVASTNHASENLYAGAPWIYCEVFYFGGQNIMQGNAQGILELPHECLDDEIANIVGMGFMPESVNCNEVIYEILAYSAFAENAKLEEFVPYYVKTKYGYSNERLEKTLLSVCREVINGTHDLNGESALCARAELDARHTSSWSNKPNPFMDQTPLFEYVEAMLAEYDRLGDNAAYRRDLMEASRQAISNLSWYFVEMIRQSYNEKNIEGVSYYGAELLSLYDIQTAIVSTQKDMLLGTWLEKARRHGQTDAEKTYFEWNARTQITLWSHREGSEQLRDYAAREWQGMLEDFYRPRWESFISRLEISLLTEKPLSEANHYDEEVPFTYRKKSYPTEPSGNLKAAAEAALAKIQSTTIVYKRDTQKQASFEENVMATVAE